MDKLRVFALLLFLSSALSAQFAINDEDKILGIDAAVSHLLPQPGTDPLYSLRFQLSGLIWLDLKDTPMENNSGTEFFLSSQHRFTLPFRNSRKVGLNTDLLPFIYLGDVNIGSHIDGHWQLLKSKNIRVMFDLHWVSLESLLLPFKDSGWHELSLRLVNAFAIGLYWNDDHFVQFSATPFFFAPGLAFQNLARSGSSGYTLALAPSGHFTAEIGVYSRLQKSWTFQKTDNHPFVGVTFGLQLYTPDLSWGPVSPPGLDWSTRTSISQLHVGLKTWLPPSPAGRKAAPAPAKPDGAGTPE